MKPTNPTPPDNGDTIPPALNSLLRLAGLGLPKTKAEVAAADKWLAENPVKLPASLDDPEAVFRRPAAADADDRSEQWLNEARAKNE